MQWSTGNNRSMSFCSMCCKNHQRGAVWTLGQLMQLVESSWFWYQAVFSFFDRICLCSISILSHLSHPPENDANFLRRQAWWEDWPDFLVVKTWDAEARVVCSHQCKSKVRNRLGCPFFIPSTADCRWWCIQDPCGAVCVDPCDLESASQRVNGILTVAWEINLSYECQSWSPCLFSETTERRWIPVHWEATCCNPGHLPRTVVLDMCTREITNLGPMTDVGASLLSTTNLPKMLLGLTVEVTRRNWNFPESEPWMSGAILTEWVDISIEPRNDWFVRKDKCFGGFKYFSSNFSSVCFYPPQHVGNCGSIRFCGCQQRPVSMNSATKMFVRLNETHTFQIKITWIIWSVGSKIHQLDLRNQKHWGRNGQNIPQEDEHWLKWKLSLSKVPDWIINLWLAHLQSSMPLSPSWVLTLESYNFARRRTVSAHKHSR